MTGQMLFVLHPLIVDQLLLRLLHYHATIGQRRDANVRASLLFADNYVLSSHVINVLASIG